MDGGWAMGGLWSSSDDSNILGFLGTTLLTTSEGCIPHLFMFSQSRIDLHNNGKGRGQSLINLWGSKEYFSNCGAWNSIVGIVLEWVLHADSKTQSRPIELETQEVGSPVNADTG